MKRLIVAGMCMLVAGFATTDCWAQADIGIKGIGGRLAFVSPDNIDGTIGFGAIADLGTFTPDIGFEATIDYWSKSEGSGDLEVTFRDIVFGARGKYMFEVDSEQLKPYAAAGLALHLFKSEVPELTFFGVTSGGDVTDTKIGLDLAGGVGYEVGTNVDILGEVMYRIVSDVSQFVISGGVIFWFNG